MRKALVPIVLVALVLVPAGAPATNTIEGFVDSFDGTKIHYYLHLPDGASASSPVPAVLRTHGWGGSGEATVGAGSTLEKLLGAGYAVLTWDQRGFGRSGGQAEIDDPDFEGRDVRALVDQVLVPRDDIADETPGDPIIGMTGGSYAGGIQFVAASVDARIDALAPEIAWHTLPQALFPNNVPKNGWDILLYGVAHSGYRGYVEQQTFTRGMVGTLNPKIHESFFTTLADNDPSEYWGFYDEHSIRLVLGGVNVPTLVINGTIDTLFPINDGLANFSALAARGVPAKLFLYNAGHTIGSQIPGGTGANSARARADSAILAWFDRYLKGNPDASTGPAVEYQVQDATWRSAAAWPAATGTIAFGGTAENLPVTPAPIGGGTIVAGNPNQPEGSARIPILTATSDTELVGIPHVSGTVSGVAPDAFLFFKLVDTTNGTVLDDQVTPWRGSVLNATVPFSLDLHGVAWVVPAGHTLALEVSTGSLMYAASRVPGVVNVTVNGTVPVV